MNEMQRESCSKLYDYLTNNNTNISEIEIFNAVEICKYYQKMNSNFKKNVDEIHEYDIFIKEFEDAISVLNEKLKILINKRLVEVYNFGKLLENDHSTFHDELLFYKNLPFNDSNIDVEKLIFSSLYGNSSIKDSYNDLISALAFSIYNGKLYGGLTIENIEKIDSFLLNEKIKYSIFSKIGNTYNNYKTNKSRLYPSDDKIRSNVANMKLFNQDNIDNYAELVVFEEQKKLIREKDEKLESQVILVSRDYGNGFGYDILSINPDNRREVLIKVEGTAKEDQNNFSLTKSELEFINNLYIQNKDADYYIYRVCMQKDNITNILKICVSLDNDKNLIFIDQDGNHYDYMQDEKKGLNQDKRKYLFKK